MTAKAKTVIIVLLILLSVIVCGFICYHKNTNNIKQISIESQEKNTDQRLINFINHNKSILKKIEIVDVKTCDTDTRSYACITLKNKTNKALNDMIVVIDLLDKDGNILSDSGDTLKSLMPNNQYTFKMPINSENTARWELSNIVID